MSFKLDIITQEGLQFFGKISASISHEIKNVLAIINENAGLLDDYALMADNGKPIDPERLKTLAEKIMKQIRRANSIVKNMNRFAHSVDEPVGRVDVGELLAFVAALSGRFASMRAVTLEPEPAANPITIMTNPFFLKNLVWLCLNFAMKAVGGGNRIGIVPEENEERVLIRFTRLENLAEVSMELFPIQVERALLDLLRAELTVDVEAGELIITLHRDGGETHPFSG